MSPSFSTTRVWYSPLARLGSAAAKSAATPALTVRAAPFQTATACNRFVLLEEGLLSKKLKP